MRVTNCGRYAVTAMLDLAMQQSGSPVTVAEVAARHDLPATYMEQLFSRLRRAGLVKGTRGPGGGYQLAKEPWEISVANVIAAVGESVDTTRCGGLRDCQRDGECLTHDLWEALNDQVLDFLSSVTLQTLAQKAFSRQSP